MDTFKVLVYEDDPAWVAGFDYNVRPKLEAANVKLAILHKEDGSTVMQDLEWIPDLILIDHDLGTEVGTDVLGQIDGDPQYVSASIFYYSGGESIESLRQIVAGFKSKVHCYTKDGDELEQAVIAKAGV